jgi:CBS domain-containing protein
MKSWLVSDVMTIDVATVTEETPYREIVDILTARRVSAVPVVDSFRYVVGVVSEADLMHKVEFTGEAHVRHLFEGRRQRTARDKANGETARDLMTEGAVTAMPDTPLAVAARRMSEAGVKRLPVVDDLGRLVGIVTRSDLLKVYLRPDEQIRADVVGGVLRRSLWVDTRRLAVEVDNGVVTLTGEVETKSLALLVVQLVRGVPGVVDVVDLMSADFDDTALVNSRAHRSHPFSAT